MTKELLIYADESAPKGRYFSNFYGGALVRSSDIDHVQSVLEQAKIDQNMLGEIKWSKVTDQYLGKYQAIMELFFDLIERDLVKLRIMFTQNMNVPTGLTVEQQRNSYFLLYYQFIKNAFGLPYSNSSDEPLYVRLFFDRLPSQKVQNQQFKDFIFNVQQFKTFKDANIHIRKSDIVEVNSHDHVVLQCMDVVLGAMYFRLNDLHKAKVPDTNRRGRRTIAKESLYKQISHRIRAIYPNFNIDITTGFQGNRENLWNHPYRHWLFVPTNLVRDKDAKKGK